VDQILFEEPRKPFARLSYGGVFRYLPVAGDNTAQMNLAAKAQRHNLLVITLID
jgi:hypothetical protein